jgi:tetraacyldisaccharide 4'-kinase
LFTGMVPRIFHDENPGGLAQCSLPLLTAASWVYGGIVRARRAGYRSGLFRQHRLPVPVLSVGNLTVGGSGKTPVVIALGELLADRGLRVAVVSRGYRGTEPGTPLVVSDGRTILCDDPDLAGDEPIVIARRLPNAVVVVCRQRSKGGILAVSELSCNAVILDDGFQHLSLARDVDILVFRSRSPWGNGRLLPRGPLRDPISAAREAHLLISISEGEREDLSLPPEVASCGVPVLPAALKTARVAQFWPAESQITPPDIRGQRVLCVSGIGSPRSFEILTADTGAEVLGHVAFRDHYRYTPEDLVRSWAQAQKEGVDLILTTEKDGVKIRRLLQTARCSLPSIPAAELRISLDFPENQVFEEISKRVRFPIQGGMESP